MQIKIAISQGQARLLAPVYLKPDAPSIYYIDVPDEMVEPSRDWFQEKLENSVVRHKDKDHTLIPDAAPGSLQARFNKILGSMARVRPGTSIGEDHQMVMDTLEARYLEH